MINLTIDTDRRITADSHAMGSAVEDVCIRGLPATAAADKLRLYLVCAQGVVVAYATDFVQDGDAAFRVLGVDNVNRIIDILVNIKGDGCLIEKPTNAEGRNWKIIFDGRQSDTPKEGANADPEEPKPLDYLIRFVAKLPRDSQYGDFAAQTDFNLQSVSQEWLRDTMVPLGYCYLTFNANGGISNTSRSADNISTGFSLQAQRRVGDRFYRLAHGNQHAAMMRRGDGNSILIQSRSTSRTTRPPPPTSCASGTPTTTTSPSRTPHLEATTTAMTSCITTPTWRTARRTSTGRLKSSSRR